MATKLYLMRHGQTLFNVQERIQGWSDSPLTALGIEQAKKAGAYFRREGLTFDALYCSTAERASDTLELVTGRTDYTRLKGIKEANFGSFEGQQEYLHPSWEIRRAQGNYYEIHGGESDETLVKRVTETLHQIAQAHDGQTVLAVSHAGALMRFLISLGVNPEMVGAYPGNCCVFVYTYKDGHFHFEDLIDPLKD